MLRRAGLNTAVQLPFSLGFGEAENLELAARKALLEQQQAGKRRHLASVISNFNMSEHNWNWILNNYKLQAQLGILHLRYRGDTTDFEVEYLVPNLHLLEKESTDPTLLLDVYSSNLWVDADREQIVPHLWPVIGLLNVF